MADVSPTPPPLQRWQRVVRNAWRHRVRPHWHNARPAALLCLGLSALVLGTIGYLQLKVPGTPRYGFLDAAYRAITLFVFGGSAPPPVPAALQIARILAPVLTGYTALATVLALTRDQARVLGIRLFVRHHVIVAGLGDTGIRLATSLVEREPLVAIESDPAAPWIATARLRGVRVLIGDARDPVVLRRAGIAHARALVVSCGADGTNVDVAAAASRACRRRPPSRPLRIFAHLSDLDLWSSLAAEGATFEGDREDVRLEYFNVLATGAQLLLERHPPFRFASEQSTAWREHVLIVGLEGVGEQLVLQIARLWGGAGPGPRDQLTITLAGPRARADLAELEVRYPALRRYACLEARELELDSAAYQAGVAMLGPDGRCQVDRAYVSLLDEGQALLAALALHARPDAHHVPVTIAVAQEGAGVAILTGSDHGRLHRIDAFGVLSAATSEELLLRGTGELLARAQHAQWLASERARPTTAPDNPNLRPWEELGERQRDENRRFADDLHAKLALVDCMLVPEPLPDPAAPRFQFSDADLELLSRHEHIRWMQTKLDGGWRYGPVRDDAHLIHDQIKPWEELDEPNREKDRDAVREIPGLLAAAGFRIQKVK